MAFTFVNIEERERWVENTYKKDYPQRILDQISKDLYKFEYVRKDLTFNFDRCDSKCKCGSECVAKYAANNYKTSKHYILPNAI